MKRLQPTHRAVLIWCCVMLFSMTHSDLHAPQIYRGTGDPNQQRFDAWLADLEAQPSPVAGLYPYFYRPDNDESATTPREFLSPMVTAKCVLYWLQRGDTDRAQTAANRLVYWQQLVEQVAHPNVSGALPTEIVTPAAGGYSIGQHFYSGDNLVVLEALVTLYEATGKESFLLGAEKTARWLRDRMCRGHEFGLWAEDHGAPMHFVTSTGDFDNRIFANVELLWIRALRHYGEVSGDTSYIQQCQKAGAFLLAGQSGYGVWYDHYDPGYPPAPYDRSNWKFYGDNVVVADNTTRAALGALRLGAHAQVERFAEWLKPESGAVLAYLDARNSRGAFDPTTPPYYDIVVSGLWRAIAIELGNEKAVQSVNAFLRRTQCEDGGWFWGVERRALKPMERRQAVITGLWAVSDLTKTRGVEP